MSDPASEPQPAKEPDAEALVQDALHAAGVRYERVFARADEIVVVLPGRGERRALARDVVAGLQKGLRRRIEVVPEFGAPVGVLMVVKFFLLAFFLLATFALMYPYLAGMLRGSTRAPDANKAANAPGNSPQD